MTAKPEGKAKIKTNRRIGLEIVVRGWACNLCQQGNISQIEKNA